MNEVMTSISNAVTSFKSKKFNGLYEVVADKESGKVKVIYRDSVVARIDVGVLPQEPKKITFDFLNIVEPETSIDLVRACSKPIPFFIIFTSTDIATAKELLNSFFLFVIIVLKIMLKIIIPTGIPII